MSYLGGHLRGVVAPRVRLISMIIAAVAFVAVGYESPITKAPTGVAYPVVIVILVVKKTIFFTTLPVGVHFRFFRAIDIVIGFSILFLRKDLFSIIQCTWIKGRRNKTFVG